MPEQTFAVRERTQTVLVNGRPQVVATNSRLIDIQVDSYVLTSETSP